MGSPPCCSRGSVGVPCAFAFGALADRIGAMTAVFGGLAVYVLITVLGYFMTTRASISSRWRSSSAWSRGARRR